MSTKSINKQLITFIEYSPAKIARFKLRIEVQEEGVFVLIIAVLVYSGVIPRSVQITGHIIRVPTLVACNLNRIKKVSI